MFTSEVRDYGTGNSGRRDMVGSGLVIVSWSLVVGKCGSCGSGYFEVFGLSLVCLSEVCSRRLGTWENGQWWEVVW